MPENQQFDVAHVIAEWKTRVYAANPDALLPPTAQCPACGVNQAMLYASEYLFDAEKCVKCDHTWVPPNKKFSGELCGPDADDPGFSSKP